MSTLGRGSGWISWGFGIAVHFCTAKSSRAGGSRPAEGESGCLSPDPGTGEGGVRSAQAVAVKVAGLAGVRGGGVKEPFQQDLEAGQADESVAAGGAVRGGVEVG